MIIFLQPAATDHNIRNDKQDQLQLVARVSEW